MQRDRRGTRRSTINAAWPRPTRSTRAATGSSQTDTGYLRRRPRACNIVDIVTGGGNDFKLWTASTSSFDGVEPTRSSSSACLDDDNMLVSNSNILVGDSGIGFNNVMFYTDQSEEDTHFNVNNAILNGVALWSLGPNGGSIDISNAQGCTQLVADIVDMDNVRFLRSSFMPTPSTGVMLFGGAAMLVRRRRA